MNRKQAKEHLALITAFAEGKEIQLQEADGSWNPVKHLYPGGSANRYRIAPPPPKVFYIATCIRPTGPNRIGDTVTVDDTAYRIYKDGGNPYWEYTKAVEVQSE